MIPRSNAMLVERSQTVEPDNKMRYCYTNTTEQMQVIRITRLPDDFFERTVLPGRQVLFEAAADAELEVHSCDVATAILTERITCDRLHQPLRT
jgi:hypothetical protein